MAIKQITLIFLALVTLSTSAYAVYASVRMSVYAETRTPKAIKFTKEVINEYVCKESTKPDFADMFVTVNNSANEIMHQSVDWAHSMLRLNLLLLLMVVGLSSFSVFLINGKK